MKKLLLLAGIAMAVTPLAAQQSPAPAGDIPPGFAYPIEARDYVKREVMIPMRDGVKLYTVIVIPKGATNAPILLTRTPYNASGRANRVANSPNMRALLPQGTSRSCGPATSASSRTCAANMARKGIMSSPAR